MADKELKGAGKKDQQLIVKNKKYKKHDVFAFVICLLLAFFIWMYASNVEKKNTQKTGEGSDPKTEVTEQTNS